VLIAQWQFTSSMVRRAGSKHSKAASDASNKNIYSLASGFIATVAITAHIVQRLSPSYDAGAGVTGTSAMMPAPG
jgi:hypothetical protein